MKRRDMPKWAFIVPSVQMSGGINVVFQHALYAIRHNARVTIVSKNSVKLRDIIWHPEAERLSFKTFEECADETFDCVIVTAWQTAYYAHLLKAYKYIYFVQSIESRFFDDASLDAWRRVGDSNSRSRSLQTNDLANRPLQPLG